MKVAVYTCITGGYDSIKAPVKTDPRIDYHYFSDAQDLQVRPWKHHLLVLPNLSPIDQNRFVKMHPFRFPQLDDYDITIYVDGSIRIVGDIIEFLQRHLEDGTAIYIYQHPFRQCVYEEAYECAFIGYASISTVARQMKRYREVGFPACAGLYEANVLVRRKSSLLEQTMNLWWHEYQIGIRRDQLSLTYAAWRFGLTIGCLGPSDPRFARRYFEMTSHNKRRPFLRRFILKRINRNAIRLVPRLGKF